jgi:hypothetical protein
MFGKSYITLIDEKWEVVKDKLFVKSIPKSGELIYIVEQEQYYKVLNVIHNIGKKQDIFVVIENYYKNS